jgi:hypothetical protein
MSFLIEENSVTNPCFLPESCWLFLIRQVFWLVLNIASFPNYFSGYGNDCLGVELTATGIAPDFNGIPF